MAGASEAIRDELHAFHRALATAAEAGVARARRAGDPVLRSRWVAVAAGRIEGRERVAMRVAHLTGMPPPPADPVADGTADVGALLRTDLAASHGIAARARRVSRLAAALGDGETARLLDRLCTEHAAHAAELSRALVLHYAREARARAT